MEEKVFLGYRFMMKRESKWKERESKWKELVNICSTIPVERSKEPIFFQRPEQTKLNTRQIDSVVETLSEEIVYSAQAVADYILADDTFNTVIDDSFSKVIDDNANWLIGDAFSRLIDDKVSNNIVSRSIFEFKHKTEADKTLFGRFQELWSVHKQALIEHITQTSFKPLNSSEVSKNHEVNRLIKEYKKSITLGISQLKNSIKRYILWSNQKPGKVVSVIKTLIKFIITPRLFGIYVSEEENNGLAVSFSNC